MNDRVRKILDRERRIAARGSPTGNKIIGVAIAGGLLLAIWNASSHRTRSVQPPPLTPLEQKTARDIARTTDISIEDAEMLVRSHRPSAAERRRWAKERKERDAAGEAMQAAFPD